MYTAIIAIFMFLLLIVFHEGGHFLAAKSVGIKVNEFSIGMGPKIFSKDKGETQYSLRALPIGGYVSMEGEDEDSNDPRSFSNASVGARIKVVAAGAFMNFLLALVLFFIVNMAVGVPTTSVKDTIEGSPAHQINLQYGDELLELNDQEITNWDGIGQSILETQEGDEISVVYKRDGEIIRDTIKITEDDGRPIIGVYPIMSHNFFAAIKDAFMLIGQMIYLMFVFLGRLFRGMVTKNDVGGPIVIINEVSKAASLGWVNLAMFLGFLNVNLGFINLLPIPALDGSRIFFLIIEGIRKKPLPVEKEGFIHFIGFVFLMVLMIYIVFLDLGKVGVF